MKSKTIQATVIEALSLPEVAYRPIYRVITGDADSALLLELIIRLRAELGGGFFGSAAAMASSIGIDVPTLEKALKTLKNLRLVSTSSRSGRIIFYVNLYRLASEIELASDKYDNLCRENLSDKR